MVASPSGEHDPLQDDPLQDEPLTDEPLPDEPLPDEIVSHLLGYLERTTDLVGVADDRGNVVYLNRAARERLRMIADDGRPVTTDDVFSDEAFTIYYEQIRPRILQGEVWTGYLPVRSGGEPVEMWVTIVGEVLAGGEVAWLVINARDVTEWRHLHEEPSRNATHDELTGLTTRALLMEHTDVALSRARRTGSSVAMMFIDIDDLKTINDSFGHQAGDAVLVEVARRLRDSVRAIDKVARVGGDEFVVLFDGVEGELEAEALATRVQALLESASIDTGEVLVDMSASAGLAVSRGNEGGHQLLGRADAHMYDIKSEHRRAPASRSRDAADDLRSVTVHDVAVAVARRAIVPYYQPVMALPARTTIGRQALARWTRPDASPLVAGSFVGVVEGSGVGFTLDLAMLRHAAAEFAARPDDDRLYLHVCSRFLTRPGVARFVREVLHHAGLAPQRLALVVPGPLVVGRAALVGDALAALRDLGLHLVVNLPVGEDFDIPTADDLFHELRLGVGWLRGTGAADESVGEVIDLAHDRGLRAHVTGVEAADQHDALVALGCDAAEGRFYAPPTPLSGSSHLSGSSRAAEPD